MDIRGPGFLAGSALFWLLYFDLKDRLRGEPRRMLVAAFVMGKATALFALAIYRVVPWLRLPAEPGNTASAIFFYCPLVVGPIEEVVKFLVARRFVYRWKHFEERGGRHGSTSPWYADRT